MMTSAARANPTTDLLTRIERPNPVFGAADVSHWPVGALDLFVRLGLLVEAEPAASAVCPSCDYDHVEPVQWVRESGLPPRVCVVCARGGIIWLNPDNLRQWAVRPLTLARHVASAVGAAGGVSERVSGRAWKLGTVRTGGRAWVGTLLIGLDRPDAAAVVAAVPELRAANAFAFVPSRLPAGSVWPAGRTPTVVALSDLLALGSNGLTADREALASALAPAGRPVAKAAARVFLTPPDTTWEQVALVVGEHDVLIRAGGVGERFGFAEAGFEDRRERDKPDDVWAVLRVLARFGGQLGATDTVNTKPGSLKQKVSVLRERLRALLALDGDPFHRTPRGQPYRARFTVRAEGAATFPTPLGAAWSDISLNEIADGLIEVAVAAESRGVEYVSADNEGTGRWEGTMTGTMRSLRYALTDFGLTESTGGTLLALLRAGGRLTRPADDSGLLEVGRALTTFFHLTEPPFAFDTKRRLWVAQFGAASVMSSSGR